MKKYLLLIVLCLMTLCIGCSLNETKGSLTIIKDTATTEMPKETKDIIIRITVEPTKPPEVTIKSPEVITQPTTRQEIPVIPIVIPNPNPNPNPNPMIIATIVHKPLVKAKSLIQHVDVRYIAFCIGGLLAILGLCTTLFLKIYSAILAIIFGSLIITISIWCIQYPLIFLTLPIYIVLASIWSFCISKHFKTQWLQ